MPELPEVEIATRQFRNFAGGKTLVRCRVYRDSIVRKQTPRTFLRNTKGKCVGTVFRKGKNLFADLGENRLWLHLGMTGKLSVRERGELPRFGRVSFDVGGADLLWLCDQRVFGGVTACRVDTLDKMSKVEDLGPDALSVSPQQLQAQMSDSTRPIKVTLMEQKRLAGLGNIHAAEALYFAKLAPSRPSNSLSAQEFRALKKGIDKTIVSALKHTAPKEGSDVVYVSEGGENPFSVYGRAGMSCMRRACKGEIEKEKQVGRSTYFCPECQK